MLSTRDRCLPAASAAYRCAIDMRCYRGDYPPHAHAHVQVMFGLAGRMELEIDGHLACVDASCGLVIPAQARHGYGAAQEARTWVLDAPGEAAFARLRRFALTPALRRELVAGDVAPVLALLRAARALRARRGVDALRLDAAVTAALHEPWETPRLAALFALSAQRFHARWVELTGTTPQDHVRALRLDAAERLLRRGRTLEATALAVGYRSASALDAALARERQTSARQLRGRR